MLQQQRLNNKGEQFVIGPTGIPLTLADLPPANTQRWVIRRKAEVVAAVRGGLLSFEEACERYKLTNEEFGAWQKSIDSHGLAVCAPRASSNTGNSGSILRYDAAALRAAFSFAVLAGQFVGLDHHHLAIDGGDGEVAAEHLGELVHRLLERPARRCR